MMKNLNMKRYVIAILVLLALTLQSCSSLGGLFANSAEATAHPTWTPQPQPTDQPYHVEIEELSYFGEDTVVAIFGSENPENTSPLLMFNLTTDDVYDFSALTPGPISTWSRPIISEDKAIFFQIGGMLYKLLPGGGVSSIEIPFDEEDPIFCNWSWQGQLVCLNDLMTQGFLVDQDLNVTEMSLPNYSVAADTITFYAPYRAGDNFMRILQTTTNSVGSRFAVHYRDLDLTTLTITDQQLVMAYDFRRKIFMNEYGPYSTPNVYELGQDYLEVLGMTDDGEQIFLEYTILSKDDLGNWIDGKYWGEIATPRDEIPVHIDLDSYLPRSGTWISNEHFITLWVNLGGYRRLWPDVYDIRTGELLFESANTLGQERIFSEILPYRENWLVLANYGVSLMNEYGHLMYEYYFPDEIIEASYDEAGNLGTSELGYSLYTITQPMEP